MNAVQVLVHSILQYPQGREWTQQGFGFLRTYLHPHDKTWRLHIWHDHMRIGDVSSIHTHPWNFESLIISGSIQNIRYTEDVMGVPMLKSQIHCGCEAHLKEEPESIRLRVAQAEKLSTGMWYRQEHHEIHDTAFSNGTVTLIRREFVNEDEDTALVYYDETTGWVNAAPQPAPDTLVNFICGEALEVWQNAGC